MQSQFSSVTHVDSETNTKNQPSSRSRVSLRRMTLLSTSENGNRAIMRCYLLVVKCLSLWVIDACGTHLILHVPDYENKFVLVFATFTRSWTSLNLLEQKPTVPLLFGAKSLGKYMLLNGISNKFSAHMVTLVSFVQNSRKTFHQRLWAIVSVLCFILSITKSQVFLSPWLKRLGLNHVLMKLFRETRI